MLYLGIHAVEAATLPKNTNTGYINFFLACMNYQRCHFIVYMYSKTWL